MGRLKNKITNINLIIKIVKRESFLKLKYSLNIRQNTLCQKFKIRSKNKV